MLATNTETGHTEARTVTATHVMLHDATDPETGESGPREVIATLPHTDQLLALKTSAGEIVTTEDHKYWNATDGEWQESQHLDLGDQILSADGSVVTVEGLDWTTVHTDTAYDLTVAEFHSFYIGAGDESVLVHNCIGIPSVTDGKLKNYVDQLYKHANKPGTIGNGTTMDAIRAEIAAGGGRHIQKGEEIARGLEKVVWEQFWGIAPRQVGRAKPLRRAR